MDETLALPTEEAARLVENLEHDSLAFRRLSFWNLRRVTNWGRTYRPEDLVGCKFRRRCRTLYRYW